MAVKQGEVLVTGAAGFFGSHLVEALKKKGHSIVCLVHPQDDTSFLESLDLKVIRGDLADTDILEQAVGGVEVIYHLAGILTSQNPDHLYKTNYEGTKNLINACKAKKVNLKRFLFTSSASVSGPTGEELANEESPCRPNNAYGRSKLLAEQFLLSDQNVFPTTIVRPVQVYGPRGLNSLYSICKIANKGILLDVLRGYLSLGFIDDVVRGIIQACEHPGTEGQLYLIGESKIYSVLEVVELVSKAVREKLIRIRTPYVFLYSAAATSEFLSKIKGTPPPWTRWQVRSYIRQCQWCYDVSKAERDWGYRHRTSLEEGVKKTVDWFKESGHLD